MSAAPDMRESMPMPQDDSERLLRLYQAGRLRWKLQTHQLEDYDAFRAWNVERQTQQHLDWVASIGANFDNMWVDECGRRFGKTVKWLFTDVEEAIRRPGTRGLIACALQKSIPEIIVPLTKLLFRDAPKGFYPEYHGTKGETHECLYIPAADSYIKLVGLDTHPDATRGQFLDFAHISEAGFVKGLEELITATIMPQFSRRPWAWIALESSTAKVPDHDFNTVFRPDASARGTYRMHTIRDNTSLTDEEIAKEERRCGGRDSVVCQRELYCVVTRDPDDMLVPEFDEAIHVVDPDEWPLPEHAIAHEGIDPGLTDPLGLVWFYLDWMAQTVVVQAAWQKPNASTKEVVEVIKRYENDVWGTEHDTPETRSSSRNIQRIGAAKLTGGGKVWEPPPGALTYWDETSWTLRPNPFSRISDIDNRFIIDLNRDYALQVRAAEKEPGSAEADLQYLRMMFAARHPDGRPKIVILRNGRTEPLIQQLRSGMWNTKDDLHRTDWSRSKLLGHCDCLAAFKYALRDAKWRRNPFPPAIRDVNLPNLHVPKRIAEKMKGSGNVIPPPKALGGYRSTWRPR